MCEFSQSFMPLWQAWIITALEYERKDNIPQRYLLPIYIRKIIRLILCKVS